MEQEVMNERVWRKVITGEKAMLAQVYIAKGGVVPEHHHESEQISYIVTGSLQFKIAGREFVLCAGQVLCILSNVPDSALALEDTLDLDIFSPIRTDWLTGMYDYLRRG